MDPRNLFPEAFVKAAEEQGAAPAAARRLLAAILAGVSPVQARSIRQLQIPHSLCDRVGELPRLQWRQSVRSPVDGFEKIQFRTADGLDLETVVIPLQKPAAVSVCVSSQVGCVMGCQYCATARMIRRRSLQSWEIVDQFVQARAWVQAQGRRVTGVVFMGMGEPFLNYENVLTAAQILRCPYGGAVAAKAISISTVGLVPEIDRYTREGHRFRLVISLGAATDSKRGELLPLAARTPVAQVMAAARRYAAARRVRVTLAYVCISGFNVGEEDAAALGQLIGETPVRLDLIDVTDPTGRYQPPSANELAEFRDALTRHVGQPVVRRYSGGKEILAACGTLAGSLPTPGVVSAITPN